MTREEAIGHIKDVICENNTIKPNMVVFEQEKEALCIAIKALEQEPCEDVINRLKAKELFEEKCVNDCGCCWAYTPEGGCGLLDELPSVTPTRTKGNFTRQELEDWLYSICLNNFGTDFGKHVEEIINRLDGFEKYIEDMRGGE